MTTKKEPKKRIKKTKSLEDLGEIMVKDSENPTPIAKDKKPSVVTRARRLFIKGGLKMFR